SCDAGWERPTGDADAGGSPTPISMLLSASRLPLKFTEWKTMVCLPASLMVNSPRYSSGRCPSIAKVVLATPKPLWSVALKPILNGPGYQLGANGLPDASGVVTGDGPPAPGTDQG